MNFGCVEIRGMMEPQIYVRTLMDAWKKGVSGNKLRNEGLTKRFQLCAVLLSHLRLVTSFHFVDDAVIEVLHYLNVPTNVRKANSLTLPK